MPERRALLLISRDNLLGVEQAPNAARVFRLLARLTRGSMHLLLTAPEPDHWFPTRGRVDHALQDQGRLSQRIQEAGGDLDGVYYVPRSLFTQDHNREQALRDILDRYGIAVSDTLLLSASAPFLKAAERLNIETREFTEDAAGAEQLEALLAVLLES
jgi:hypothetical protein